ncbi:MAG: HlyD family efflux transporter periplasmic adaptor subunit, partial [Calditrichia bacterium]
MRGSIAIAAGLIFFAGLLLSVSCSPDQQQANTAGEKGTPVQITHPVKTDITEYLNLNATTIFLNKEVVRATFQGFIEQVYKDIGDPVKSGDRLFLIKTRESAATDSLRIDIGDELFRGAVAVRAHTGGILTELDYHMGDYVSDGEQIAVVSDPLSLHINLNVPYQFVSQIEKGSRCDIILPDGRTLDATIQKIIPMVDPNSQTQRYLLRLDQKVSLPESLNVDARLPLKATD